MASSSSSGGSNASDVPWVEKYRPIDFKDFVGNEDAISRLEAIASSDFRDTEIPNLILSGPSGTGKTSSVLALAHKIFGLNYKEFVLELDASDERGIDVVMNEIRMFGQKNPSIGTGRYRIVILDKAESMTYGAQQVLSQVMEICLHSTRFALTCSTSSDMVDIIEPIQSRCTHVRFSRLSDEVILRRLMKLKTEEKVSCTPSSLAAVVFLAVGNMRQALNILQATYVGFPSVNPGNVFEAYRKQVQFLNENSIDCNATESNSDGTESDSDDASLGSENSPSVGTSDVEKRSFQKQEGDEFEFNRYKLLCLRDSLAQVLEENRLCWNEAGGILCSILPSEKRPSRSVDHGFSFMHQAIRVSGNAIGHFRDERNEAAERAAKLAPEKEEFQNSVRDWKVRYADVDIERKEAKKRLKMVEKEKAELLQKVAGLEKAQAE